MCTAPKAPEAPPPLPVAPRYAPPTSPETAAEDARNEEALRRRAASGFAGTILTGSQGVTAAASTTGKTLLGA